MERFEKVKKILEEFGGKPEEKDPYTYNMLGSVFIFYKDLNLWNMGGSLSGGSIIWVNFDHAAKCDYGGINLYSSGKMLAKISI